MKTSHALRMRFGLVIPLLWPLGASAQDLKPVQIPKPQTNIGRPLMQVLEDRRSTRSFSPRKLSPQEMSNLLWAAFGVNRPDLGKRTAPSAMNWQETDIYVATSEGLYLYDARANELKPILSEDVRALTGTQSFVKDAPVDLVYVADLAKTRGGSAERDTFVAADVGVIAENVYLFCASEGLATVVRGSIDKPALAKAMRLRPGQKIILAQSVGYPSDKDYPQAGIGGYGMPVCRFCPNPTVTQATATTKYRGNLIFRLVVNTDGRSEDIQVLRSPDPGLNQQLVATVQTWRWKPAPGPDGKPAAVMITVEVSFRQLQK